jgi:hypothetical protein
VSSQWHNRPITIVPMLLCAAASTLVPNQFTPIPFLPEDRVVALGGRARSGEGHGLPVKQDGQHTMEDRRARFRARVQLHVGDGWEVVHIDDDHGAPLAALSALVTKVTIGQPRSPGSGVASQEGQPRHYCRRISVDGRGAIRVSTVTCPPEVLTRPGMEEDIRA